MAKKVITFGEIMLRLAPEATTVSFSQQLWRHLRRGEANVAVSLANYGMDAAFVTKLPKHEIGQAAVNELRKYGVDTKDIARGGDRVGIYFLEKGASQRPSKVIYDRAHSAISELPRRTSTGQRSLKAPTGSTSQASPRPSTTPLPVSA